METKVCTKCGKEKQVTEFYWVKARDNYLPSCKSCSREYRRLHPRTKNKTVYNPVTEAKRRKKKKDYMSTIKMESGCIRCGFKEAPSALVFHHREPNEKSFEIGTRGYAKRRELLDAEIAKCDILCANCHNMLHAGVWQ